MAPTLPEAKPRAGVVYRHSVEALLTNVVKKQSLMRAEELKAFNLERARDVTSIEWEKFLRTVALKLNANEEIGLELLGREMLKSYSVGLVGRSLFVVLRLLGPRRSLMRMAENFKTADSLTEVIATERAPKHVELLFNDIGGMPTYVQGLLSEALTLLGAPKHEVTYSAELSGFTKFVAKWS